MVHDSFMPMRMDGEAAGGWLALLFRICVITAALLGRSEHYIVDSGVDGENGKGFLWACCEKVFGALASALSLGMLERNPPEAGKATPEVWMLKV